MVCSADPEPYAVVAGSLFLSKEIASPAGSGEGRTGLAAGRAPAWLARHARGATTALRWPTTAVSNHRHQVALPSPLRVAPTAQPARAALRSGGQATLPRGYEEAELARRASGHDAPLLRRGAEQDKVSTHRPLNGRTTSTHRMCEYSASTHAPPGKSVAP